MAIDIDVGESDYDIYPNGDYLCRIITCEKVNYNSEDFIRMIFEVLDCMVLDDPMGEIPTNFGGIVYELFAVESNDAQRRNISVRKIKSCARAVGIDRITDSNLKSFEGKIIEVALNSYSSKDGELRMSCRKFMKSDGDKKGEFAPF